MTKFIMNIEQWEQVLNKMLPYNRRNFRLSDLDKYVAMAECWDTDPLAGIGGLSRYQNGKVHDNKLAKLACDFFQAMLDIQKEYRKEHYHHVRDVRRAIKRASNILEQLAIRVDEVKGE